MMKFMDIFKIVIKFYFTSFYLNIIKFEKAFEINPVN